MFREPRAAGRGPRVPAALAAAHAHGMRWPRSRAEIRSAADGPVAREHRRDPVEGGEDALRLVLVLGHEAERAAAFVPLGTRAQRTRCR